MTEYIRIGNATYKSIDGRPYRKVCRLAVALMIALSYVTPALPRSFDDTACVLVCGDSACVLICDRGQNT